jgi:hypothetical protein
MQHLNALVESSGSKFSNPLESCGFASDQESRGIASDAVKRGEEGGKKEEGRREEGGRKEGKVEKISSVVLIGDYEWGDSPLHKRFQVPVLRTK